MVRKFLHRFLYRMLHDDVTSYAAQISYYMIVSIFPFVTFVGMILTQTGLITTENVYHLLQQIHTLPDAFKEIIVSAFSSLEKDSNIYFSIYIIIIIYSASHSIRSIMNGIHMAYRTVETRPLILRFLISFFYVVAFAIMIALFVALVLFGEALSKAAFSFLGLNRFYKTVITYARFLLPALFMLVIYLLLYRFIPTKPMRFRFVWPGAVFATVLSFAVSAFFSSSVSDMSRYQTLYGSIYQIVIIIIWLWFISLTQLLGAIFNATLVELSN